MNYFKITLLIGILSTLCACSSETQYPESSSSQEESAIPDNKNDEVVPIEQDFSSYHDIMAELEGIERHYVRGEMTNLLILWEFKSDERASKLRAELEDMNESRGPNAIIDLDVANGYVLHNRGGAQADLEMTYWKMSNGNELIAESPVFYMSDPTDISFELFDSKNEEYKLLDIEEVISSFHELEAMATLMDPELGPDGGCTYKLPQTGKNILFCADDTCIDLIWNDGTFTLDK